jgi:putative ABC transport system permease protein
MMDWIRLVFGNARRSPARGMMTVGAVAVSLVAFALVRMVSASWTEQVRQTPDNRVITRNKLGWQAELPVHYVQTLRELPGVRHVMGGRGGRLVLPLDRDAAFDSFAVAPEEFVAMHYELLAPEDQKREFVATRRAALVSEELAKESGWAVGDELHFKSRWLPGEELVFTLAGIFRSARQGFARRAVFFHWEYLNERLPERDRDKITYIVSEIEDPRQGARLARQIDMKFDTHEHRTLSQEDQAMNAQIVGQFSAILDALDIVSVLILGIVLMVLGNTLAMAVRERSKEYATLRVLGFRRKHVLGLVLGEATLLGVAGGVLAVLLSFPLVERAGSIYLNQMLGLAPLRISFVFALVIALLGVVLGAVAALFPGYQLTRGHIAEALRRPG